jgi:predicted nucleotidyltransferase
MRLTDQQIEQIKAIGRGIYGNGVRIFLFGSRTDDEKRGGDIDLFIETEDDQVTTVENKLNCLVRLKLALGDQKIDLIYPKNIENRSASKNSIFNNRIRLC